MQSSAKNPSKLIHNPSNTQKLIPNLILKVQNKLRGQHIENKQDGEEHDIYKMKEMIQVHA
ncbi:hypothetical protein Scep_019599 [Stephania cephalantha]|uniref:Uncharacterized protein n=1 Tax=Stephania cephalantha TaxID=152367 RepID=A0AAP0IBH6_9MAGN